jgi:iron complex transport system substrate-binding protein
VLRPRPAALALVAATLLAAGCGGAAAETGDSTRRVTGADGRSVEVPAAPKRVVALSEPTLDGLLALGVKPVATTAGRGQGDVSSYLAERAAGIPSVGALGRPNLERLAGLRPDLILLDGTSTQDDALVDKLERIAPTVYVSRTGQSWRSAFSSLAAVVGLKARGAARLAAFDARVAEIKRRLAANAGAKVSVVRWSGIGLPATLLQELAVSRVLKQLGLTRPAGQLKPGPGHSVPVSLENLDQLDGDWLFFASLGAGGAGPGSTPGEAGVRASTAALELASESRSFRTLRAYRARRVVPVDGSAWTSAGGLLAEHVVLDDVERSLAR